MVVKLFIKKTLLVFTKMQDLINKKLFLAVF